MLVFPFLATALILGYNRGSNNTYQVKLLETIPVRKTMHDLLDSDFTAEPKLQYDLLKYSNYSDSIEKQKLQTINTNAEIHLTTISDNNEPETAVRRIKISNIKTTVLKNSIESLRLVYIKTRKTGSSTMTNILYRLALRHNLTVMTFLHRTSHPTAGKQFPVHQLNFLLGQPQPSFNLIMEHLYYDEGLFDELMPGNKIFISTLRYPFDQLMSDVHYQQRRMKNPKPALSQYERLQLNSYTSSKRLSNLEQEDVLQRILMSPEKLKRYGQRYLKIPKVFTANQPNDSQMVSETYNHTAIKGYLQELSSKFQLVLITEYYDASLVLLKRKLSWELRDIIYSPLKRGRYVKSPNLQTRHQQLKPEEYALYDHFNQTFWTFLSEQSPDFWKEVEHYKKIKDKSLRFCDKYYSILEKDATEVKTIIKQNATLQIQKSPWNEPFTVDTLDCILMKTHKNTFLNLNTIRNFPSLCEKAGFRLNPKSINNVRKFSVLGNRPIFDQRFCLPVSTRYQLPVDVFSVTTAYDWDDYFKAKIHHR